AWLGAQPDATSRQRCVSHLSDVSARHDGLMPVASPITEFERAWVLAFLAEAGFRPAAAHGLLRQLRQAVGEFGAPGGTGLPPDADTTSAAIYVLASHGITVPVACLAGYERQSWFCTYPDERTASTTTNAHVLEALACRANADKELGRRWGGTIGRLTAWLRDQQRSDGSWTDKWHASPYYATVCCALAFARAAAAEGDPAVSRAVAWVLATQRDDGSWGRWSGTVEETSYAVRTLLGVRSVPVTGAIAEAAARGGAYLRDRHDEDDHP